MIARESLDWLKELRLEANRAYWEAEKRKESPIYKELKETADRMDKAYKLALGMMAEPLIDTAEEALKGGAGEPGGKG